MPFLMNCNNKGCGKYTTPELNLSDNEVYCPECGKQITNVNHFTKVQMKTIGQTAKKKKQSYAIKCNKCKAELTPIILNDALTCAGCKTEFVNVSKPFELIVREFLKNGNPDI